MLSARIRLALRFAPLVALGLLTPLPLAAQAPDRTVSITRAERPPRLEDFITNGRLGPAAEEPGAVTDGEGGSVFPGDPRGVRITGFRQREPGDGDPVSQPTTAYLSYDQANFYVVFVCRDDPEKVRANISRREDMRDDDQVSLYLDTFNDGKRAYLFAANPHGVQLDGIRTEGQDEDLSFDAVWTSDGRLTDDGYVVLMAIPFRSLRFTRSAEQTWGIALGREIQRTNEETFWPYITDRVQGFVPQFGTLQGLSNVSPGRNMQVNPYFVQARARLFDDDIPGHSTENDTRVGVDGKMVLRDAFTLDGTVNPDFSQVESDDPQVTVNERFEVFFPEKRPFFLENAGYFQTPENLFFTRRIVDPGVGLRLTGKTGRWAVGAVAINDRANDRLDLDEPLFADDAWIGALRVEREIGEESTVGILMTDREFNNTRAYDRVFSADSRIRLGDNWEFEGQVMRSARREPAGGERFSGWGYMADAGFETRNLNYKGGYLEFTPDFDAPLGFIERVGFRDMQQELGYIFFPDGFVTEYGPAVKVEYLWDHKTGLLLDREFEGVFSAALIGDSELEIAHRQLFERFEEQDFRPHETEVAAGTAWFKWLFLDASYLWGTAVNHDPADDVEPSLMKATERQAEVTVLPTAWLRLGIAYEDLSLHTRPSSTHVLTERQLRTKINYQYNRELSLRAIIDYALLNADETLVDEEREREWGMDLLLTYLVNPGTALYVGYIDQFENLSVVRAEDELDVIRSRSPDLSTGRQLFVKLSYLVRF